MTKNNYLDEMKYLFKKLELVESDIRGLKRVESKELKFLSVNCLDRNSLNESTLRININDDILIDLENFIISLIHKHENTKRSIETEII